MANIFLKKKILMNPPQSLTFINDFLTYVNQLLAHEETIYGTPLHLKASRNGKWLYVNGIPQLPHHPDGYTYCKIDSELNLFSPCGTKPIVNLKDDNYKNFITCHGIYTPRNRYP
jgi:hypothetical protein